MVAPFATVADLQVRGLTVADEEVAEQLLEDASDVLRDEIGWQVYPTAEITVPAVRDHLGRLVVPGVPRSALTEGTAADGTPTVTYTVGYTQPPSALVRWTCVLAAQMLAELGDGRLGGGTPASEALAEYRITYSERQQMGDLPIPPRQLERLRSTYGQAVYVA
ncbi:hypothetical protein [Blastococcus sp. SYSU D00813]